jgi:arylsulfatase A-like enzyme
VRAAGRPNILLILADDMGYSDVSPYGGEMFTPNIARLAAQGMMLTISTWPRTVRRAAACC